MIRFLRNSYLALIYAFFYLPILVLIAYSFNQAKYPTHWAGFSWRWYLALFQNERLWEATLHSLLIALLAASFATLIGTLTAISFHRYRFRGQTSLYALIYSVLMAPDIVLAITLLLLFIALGIKLGFWSLLLAHITFCLPFAIITISARLADFEVQLLDAARDLGANHWQLLWYVMLPLIWPAMVASWLLAFTLSLDDVIISFFVTGPSYELLPLRIYSMVRLGVKPEVNALCTVLFAGSLLLVLLATQLLDRSSRGRNGI